MTQHEPSLIIAAMLSGFPASIAIDPDLQIRAYLMAIDGIEHEAVARAARNFISGSVKGHNRSFAPSCAEFSEECRTMQATIQAERRPRLQKPEKVDAGPRVAPWKLKLLQQALGGNNTAREKLRKMFPAIDIPDAPEPVSEEGQAPSPGGQ